MAFWKVLSLTSKIRVFVLAEACHELEKGRGRGRCAPLNMFRDRRPCNLVCTAAMLAGSKERTHTVEFFSSRWPPYYYQLTTTNYADPLRATT